MGAIFTLISHASAFLCPGFIQSFPSTQLLRLYHLSTTKIDRINFYTLSHRFHRSYNLFICGFLFIFIYTRSYIVCIRQQSTAELKLVG